MASWRPMKREADSLSAALIDYLRNRAAKVFLDKSPGPRRLGRSEATMSDGATLAIDLAVTPEDSGTFAGRAALILSVHGHAASATAGYEVSGRIVLDRSTLAFLSIEASTELVNRGREALR